VERLRVVAAGELDDLGLVDAHRAELQHEAGPVILEPALLALRRERVSVVIDEASIAFRTRPY